MAAKRPFPRQVRVMGWVSFWSDVASEMVYPIVPLFIVGALKAPATVLGLTEGAAGILLNLVRGWSGWLSDRTGRCVPFIVAGYGVTAVSKPLTALATTWPFVMAVRLADRMGKGLRHTPRDALLADSVEAKDAGKAFGYHRAMDAGGAVVGSLIGFLLLMALPGQYRLIFAVTAVPGIVAVLLTLTLRETRAKPRTEPQPHRQRAVSIPPLSRRFKRVLGVSLVFGLANSSDTFLLLKARDLGLSDAMVVLSYVLFNVVYSVSAYPLGAWSDRVGRRKVLAVGWSVYALTYFAFAWAPVWAVWPLMALYGLYNGACDGTSKAWVGDASVSENRGTAMGVYAMGSGLASLAASLTAGILWDQVGHEAPFVFAGAVAVVSVACLALLTDKD